MAIGIAHDLVEGSREKLAVLQDALLSTQPARAHRAVRIAASFVVLIHDLNRFEGWPNQSDGRDTARLWLRCGYSYPIVANSGPS